MLSIFISFMILSILFTVLFRISFNKDTRMEPTIAVGDLLLIKRKKTIKRFDIVLCNINDKLVFLRVVGLPEETLTYLGDNLYIDGEYIQEKFIVDQVNSFQKEEKHYTDNFNLSLFGQSNVIPKNHYLLLGDNRPYSNDSRYYGLISQDKIKGVVTFSLIPFSNIYSF